MTEKHELRLRLLDKYYGLVKAASTVDASSDDLRTLFRERRKAIQDRMDAISRHLEDPAPPELFDMHESYPEIDALISDPLADLPRST